MANWKFWRRPAPVVQEAPPPVGVPRKAPTKPEPPVEPKGARLLLLDMPSNAEEAFEEAGFRVQVGSLGQPFEVHQSDRYVPVPIEKTLPVGWTESEIVVVDLRAMDPVSEPRGKKVTSQGELDWWAKCSTGVVDPRVRVAKGMQENCDRIYRHGGAFIVFMAPEVIQEITTARVGAYDRVETQREIRAYPWSFLSVLDGYLNVSRDTGTEIRFDSGFESLKLGLGPWLKSATYVCTLGLGYHAAAKASAFILRNKFDEPVGLVTNWEEQKGVVILLPQVRDKTGTALAVIEHLLPSLTPDLFPDKASANWLRTPPYQHPAIVRLENEIEELRETLERQVATVESRIGQIRAERSFLHDLLTESGDALKDSVRAAFNHLGIEVVDVDAAGEDETHGLMEDLRIDSGSPMVLVEVKGIYGKPTDEDALQVTKYLAPAMKRTGRTDVKGLTVVNHERHRPGSERDHVGLFRPLVLESAASQEVGLMTTWDLFWLCRNYEALGWTPAQVAPLFSLSGRISPIPVHYCNVAVVERVWPEAMIVGLRVTGVLSVGDRVAFSISEEFHEATVVSMQLENQECETVTEGAGVGVRLDEWRAPTVGGPCYRVDSDTPQTDTAPTDDGDTGSSV